MEYADWKQIAHKLLAAYPSSAAQAETVVVFFEALQDFRTVDVAEACEKHLRRSRWFPAVSDLLELVWECQQQRAERERLAGPALPAEDGTPCSPERAREHMAEVKKMLSRVGREMP